MSTSTKALGLQQAMTMSDSLGKLADDFFLLREKKRAIEEQLEAVEQEMRIAEMELLSQLDAQQVTKVTGKMATVSISESVKPSVEDWSEFENYIHDNRYYHLLERRPSVLGCREIFEKVGRIPGVVPYVQRKVRMLKI